MADLSAELAKFRELLEKTLAECEFARRKFLELQMRAASASLWFEENYRKHTPDEFVPGREYVARAKFGTPEYNKMFGNGIPDDYVDAVKGDAKKAAGGDEEAVRVADEARELGNDIEFMLEEIDDAVRQVGGGDLPILSDRAKGHLVALGADQVEPAQGNSALYEEIADELWTIRARFEGVKAKAEEVSDAYDEEPGALFAGDDEETVYVKKMYERYLEKIVVLTDTRSGLDGMLMDLSGYFEYA
jgi:hypothetical protein